MNPSCSLEYEEWLKHWQAFQICLRNCRNDALTEQNICVKHFPVPPSTNIEQPAIDCLNFSAFEHDRRTHECTMRFRAGVCFDGEPTDPNPSSAVDEDVQKVKKAVRQATITMATVGISIALGGTLTNTASSLPSLARFKGLLGLVGGFMQFTGIGIAAISLWQEKVRVDPPDSEFQEMAQLRRIAVADCLPAGFLSLPLSSKFAPMAVAYLQAFLHAEAFLSSIEKSAGAKAAADSSKEQAHIRVAREYAGGFAEWLTKALTARIAMAATLAELLAEAEDHQNDDRRSVSIDLGSPGGPERSIVVQSRTGRSQAVLLALQDAIELHAKWVSGELHLNVSHAIDALASERQPRGDFLAGIGAFVPSSEFFNRSPSQLLANSALGAIESRLAASYSEFAGVP